MKVVTFKNAFSRVVGPNRFEKKPDLSYLAFKKAKWQPWSSRERLNWLPMFMLSICGASTAHHIDPEHLLLLTGYSPSSPLPCRVTIVTARVSLLGEPGLYVYSTQPDCQFLLDQASMPYT